jgi:dihydrofolate reductase
MRKIIVTTFITMDGVMQAPGGPDEDRTNDFKWGGWQFGYSDEKAGEGITKIMSSPFDLLLGRRTYEIFAAYWPYQHDAIAEKFNRVNKYVVATTPVDTSWSNSILINTDVVNQLKKLKAQDGPDLLVHGSSVLLQTLFAEGLVDVLHLWTYPITLGKGKKLFREGTPTREWKLAEVVVSTTGAIMATYLAAGEVKLGTYGSEKVSEAELERQKKWKHEEEV